MIANGGVDKPDLLIECALLHDTIALPKKGKLSVKDQEREYAEEFKQTRKKIQLLNRPLMHCRFMD